MKIARGLTIDVGAQFNFLSMGPDTLVLGTTFVVLDNTSALPISGIFANLPEGAILASGNNHLQASYVGGDDLTRTVVP